MRLDEPPSFAILSVNVGRPAPLGTWQGEAVTSAIRKLPVMDANIAVSATNLGGDAQADLSVHGGPDKALYAYPALHADWWEARGVAYRPGFMGENLTLDGPAEDQVHIGDVFAWGPEVMVQVSEPRGPCFKLGLLTGQADAPQQMVLSGHCGWYMRVLGPGTAPVQGSLTFVSREAGSPSVRETFLAKAHRKLVPEARVRAIMATPTLGREWRATLERALRS
ncbi:MAG TPA: MOSC domain-containing protein [Alphaproteobacteria bacterium]|nr:MOSC domain-containing protein [Alphaproteobacteria bacterium]HAJ45690.1 MOSC domain-containing protein [Alphaproteobacteria bacterium]